MTPLFLLNLQRRGIILQVAGVQLRYHAPPGAVTSEIRSLLAENKPTLIELLANPRRAARETWAAAVEQIASRWDDVAAVCRTRGMESPWLDQEVEESLDEAIAASIRAGDLQGALRGIEAWRRAWMDLLSTSPGRETPGAPRSPAGAVAIHLDAVRLFDLADDPDVPEADREVYRSEVLRRADAMIAESEGRIPHWNQAVRDMHSRAGDGVCPYPGHRRWHSTSGAVICGYCHPPANPSLVAEWIEAPSNERR